MLRKRCKPYIFALILGILPLAVPLGVDGAEPEAEPSVPGPAGHEPGFPVRRADTKIHVELGLLGGAFIPFGASEADYDAGPILDVSCKIDLFPALRPARLLLGADVSFGLTQSETEDWEAESRLLNFKVSAQFVFLDIPPLNLFALVGAGIGLEWMSATVTAPGVATSEVDESSYAALFDVGCGGAVRIAPAVSLEMRMVFTIPAAENVRGIFTGLMGICLEVN
ncbi:MAG: hypothetical protein ACYTHM_02445 [Planctomycetota bacterium]|jgi:hypothetical protein